MRVITLITFKLYKNVSHKSIDIDLFYHYYFMTYKKDQPARVRLVLHRYAAMICLITTAGLPSV